jgi:hypothetical protein
MLKGIKKFVRDRRKDADPERRQVVDEDTRARRGAFPMSSRKLPNHETRSQPPPCRFEG